MKSKGSQVRLDRLQEFQDFRFSAICRALVGTDTLSHESLSGVEAYDSKASRDSDNYDLGRIKFFVDNPLAADPILIGNGSRQGLDLGPDEPCLFDGRHRYLAAVLRGDETIPASFGIGYMPRVDRLPQAVIDYLTGKTDVKPETRKTNSAEVVI